jgi:2'-5' RNA ligase
MRLFTGLDVPWQMRRNLELLIELLRPKAGISWSPLGNVHVTTKFIGDWPEHRLDELKRALAAVPRSGELQIAIRGLGWFPNPHQPRILIVGVDGGPALASLAKATDEACAALGIEPENRPFHPHLTLARVRAPRPLFELKKAIADLPDTDFGAYPAGEFHLYKSDLRPGGSVYTKLASYSLNAS